MRSAHCKKLCQVFIEGLLVFIKGIFLETEYNNTKCVVASYTDGNIRLGPRIHKHVVWANVCYEYLQKTNRVDNWKGDNNG
jgi:hypothetical protein